ncbi:outer membrane lipoprotein carrier protein LolA [Streptomyces sp. NPDC051217]|uniref:outer membrane lipoprotein carrier protein LolA n=1 Tax=Streptomyces sp. NPDC051217 TaxID=3365644 RepID=UPI0037A87BEF
MAPNDSAQITGGNDEAEDLPAGRRRAARYVVPVAVASVAAATIGLVPALAASGDPDLPKITAAQLIEKMAASETERLSGTVKITTDLGIPSLGGLGDLGGSAAGALAPKGGADNGKDGGSAAEPTGRLMDLASGEHTLRVATDGPDKQRLSILDSAAEYSLIHNGGEVWAYDSASNEAYHAEAPADAAKGTGKDKNGTNGKDQAVPKDLPATPRDFAREALKASGDTTSVTVDGTARIAGRDAYQLVIKPKQAGSTVGSIKVAVDSKTGTPLKFTLLPSSGGKAVVDVGFTKVDFSRPAASTFDFTPPKGAKVTEADQSKATAGKDQAHKAPKDAKDLGSEPNVIGEGWTAVVQLDTGAKAPTAAASKDMPAEAQQFMDALGDKAQGKFGSGTVFKTRLVNALMTDDGKVFVGAVTKDALIKAANEAK